jgi:thermostable 8-oxoguanine DNA glycosylase
MEATIREFEEEMIARTLIFDPRRPTNYDRTPRELELFFLFTIFVANKPAMITAEKLTNIFGHITRMPREYLKWLGPARRMNLWRHHRLGQYKRIEGAVAASLGLRLDVCTVNHLTAIPGIGNKTARFFLLHSRRAACYAVIDTHILKYLRAKGFSAPASTPSTNSQYEILECLWLNEIKHDFPGMTAAEADLAIWRKYSGN